MFKLWSETNPQAKKALKPDFGLRSWDNLSEEEKNRIWHYTDSYFFARETYVFSGNYLEEKCKRESVWSTIHYLNETYKARCYAETYLKNPDLNTACFDFLNIFMNGSEVLVMETLSIYANFLYLLSKDDINISQKQEEKEEDFEKRKIEAGFKYFDNFANRLNDVFLQFGIKYYLTREGFAPRQDEKIMKEIYEPVLSYLSDPIWEEVNHLLADAFNDYMKNTPQGYSSCVTNVVSVIQGFLQITVEGKTGKGEISKLIPEAQNKGLIPNDYFTTKVFENLESILVRERQETSTAHPKKQYANEKNSRMMLNLTMIFIQHCMQK